MTKKNEDKFYPNTDHMAMVPLDRTSHIEFHPSPLGLLGNLTITGPIVVDSPPKKEKEVCAELKKYWKDNGYFVIRNQQGIGSVKGLADYTIVRGSHVIFVEVKATKGKQSPYQKDFQLKLESVGGYYRLVHSLEEFLEGC